MIQFLFLTISALLACIWGPWRVTADGQVDSFLARRAWGARVRILFLVMGQFESNWVTRRKALRWISEVAQQGSEARMLLDLPEAWASRDRDLLACVLAWGQARDQRAAKLAALRQLLGRICEERDHGTWMHAWWKWARADRRGKRLRSHEYRRRTQLETLRAREDLTASGVLREAGLAADDALADLNAETEVLRNREGLAQLFDDLKAPLGQVQPVRQKQALSESPANATVREARTAFETVTIEVAADVIVEPQPTAEASPPAADESEPRSPEGRASWQDDSEATPPPPLPAPSPCNEPETATSPPHASSWDDEPPLFSDPVPVEIVREGGRRSRRARRNERGRWIQPGELVEVAGFQIRAGLFYVGGSLQGGGFTRGEDPVLIDPALPVARNAPSGGAEDAGWDPDYGALSPDQRAEHLAWHAGGRNNPSIPTWNLLLWAGGIERRMLLDIPQSIDGVGQLLALAGELARLVKLHAHQAGFERQAGELLCFLVARLALHGETPNLGDLPLSYDVPVDLQVRIAQAVKENRTVPPGLAAEWYLRDTSFSKRIAAKRCHREFEALLSLRIEEQHGGGLTARLGRKKLEIGHFPRFCRAGEGMTINTGLRDVSALDALRMKIHQVAQECATALSPLSRHLLHEDDAHSLAAIAHWPSDLLRAREPRALKQLKTRLASVLGGMDRALTRGQDVATEWLPPTGNRMSKKSADAMARLFAIAGYGLEPDVRFGGHPTAADDPLVLFRLEAGDADAESPSPEYAAASLLMTLAAMVAAVDGHVDERERSWLSEEARTGFTLDGAERRRLEAQLMLALEHPPRIAKVKARMQRLSAEQRELTSQFLMAVALADGALDRREVRLLEDLHRFLDLDADRLHEELHQRQAAASAGAPTQNSPSGESDDPVLVQSATGEAPTYAIPAPPPETTSERPFLDMSVVQAKMAATQEVSGLLSSIFEEEDATSPPSQPTNTEAGGDSEVAGLDAAHARILRALGVQETWSCDAFEELIMAEGLFVDGAVELLNDLAFDQADAALIEEDGDGMSIDLDVWKELVP